MSQRFNFIKMGKFENECTIPLQLFELICEHRSNSEQGRNHVDKPLFRKKSSLKIPLYKEVHRNRAYSNLQI